MRRLKAFTTILLCTLVWAPSLVGVEIPYTVEFIGVQDRELLELLYETSECVQLHEFPPATQAALRQRAEGDVPQLILQLRGAAYYNSRINLDYRFEQGVMHVIFDVSLGPSYPFSEVRVIPHSTDGILPLPREEDTITASSLLPFMELQWEDLDICGEQAATAESILEAEDLLMRALHQNSFPIAHLLKREVFVDQATQSVILEFHIAVGPRLRFGNIAISGLDCVQEIFVRRRVEWCAGDWFDPCLVDLTREALEGTSLFSTVTILANPEAIQDDEVGILIQLSEARHRTVGFGLDYSTQLGPGGTAEWEHRNLFGRGERFSFVADISQKLQEGTLSYRMPDFGHVNQTLVLLTELAWVETDGFEERSLTVSAGVNRKVSDCLSYSYALQGEYLKVTESDTDGNTPLLKLPMRMRWSTVDSTLSPTCGHTLITQVIPTLQFPTDQDGYVTLLLTGTYYHPFDCEHNTVYASKLSLGSIIGASRASIPPPDRLYAGTDNLLRGYNYLSVSPLDNDGKPIGGRSLLVYSGELRHRMNQTMGWVGFFEVGNVYRNSIPKLDEDVLVSIGAGVRYHTPVGPLRFDLAIPLNRRASLDDAFQVYFSLGQAF